jgi:hypothetical protein
MLKRAMVAEDDESNTEFDSSGAPGMGAPQGNGNDTGSSEVYVPVALLPPLPINHLKNQKKHFGNDSRNSIPETSSRKPSIRTNGTQRYALGPWERPASRGAIEQNLKNTARARRISKSSMLYSKRSEQLGYENAHRGRPTNHFSGKKIFPLNHRHPKAKPPNPHDDASSVNRAPFATETAYMAGKDRFSNVGSMKPIFTSPYNKRKNNSDGATNDSLANVVENDDVVSISNYSSVSGVKQSNLRSYFEYNTELQEVGRLRNQLNKAKGYLQEQHITPKPPPQPILSMRLNEKKKRAKQRMMDKKRKQARYIATEMGIPAQQHAHVSTKVARPPGHRYNKPRIRPPVRPVGKRKYDKNVPSSHGPRQSKYRTSKQENNHLENNHHLYNALKELTARKNKYQHHAFPRFRANN